jgi:hypothetical protein
MRRFVLCFAAAGFLLPASWFAIYHLSPRFEAWWYGAPSWLGRLLLAIWPSWLLMLADPDDKSLILPIVSATLNAGTYGLLGALLWVGFRRSRAVLAVTLAAVLAGWYVLLGL